MHPERFLSGMTLSLFSWLTCLLIRVVERQEVNKMDPKNCAIVWGPGMIGSATDTAVDASGLGAMDGFEDTRFGINFVELNVRHHYQNKTLPYGASRPQAKPVVQTPLPNQNRPTQTQNRPTQTMNTRQQPKSPIAPGAGQGMVNSAMLGEILQRATLRNNQNQNQNQSQPSPAASQPSPAPQKPSPPSYKKVNSPQIDIPVKPKPPPTRSNQQQQQQQQQPAVQSNSAPMVKPITPVGVKSPVRPNNANNGPPSIAPPRPPGSEQSNTSPNRLPIPKARAPGTRPLSGPGLPVVPSGSPKRTSTPVVNLGNPLPPAIPPKPSLSEFKPIGDVGEASPQVPDVRENTTKSKARPKSLSLGLKKKINKH